MSQILYFATLANFGSCYRSLGHSSGACRSVRLFFYLYLFSLSSYNFFLCRKDVRLPVQLQRAMAAEAEAAREARAKVR